uniref:Uncharacterized protein n=1 Tax=Anguilla anguilla TaxID=7936 RepID=A0A0E9UD34_ANGAN
MTRIHCTISPFECFYCCPQKTNRTLYKTVPQVPTVSNLLDSSGKLERDS